MELQELREKISQAKSPDWFASVEFNFHNKKGEIIKNLIGFSAIYEYVTQQAIGWSEKKDPIPAFFDSNKGSILALKSRIDSFLHTAFTLEIKSLRTNWVNDIQSIHKGLHIPYELPEVDFLINLNKEYPMYAGSAFNFLFGTIDIQHQGHNKDYLIGLIMAYEFVTKDSSQILARKDSEINLLNATKKDTSAYLNQVESDIREVFAKTNLEKEESLAKIEKLKEEKDSNFNQWFTETSNSYNGFRAAAESRIKDLENTYQDQLRLKEPAEYWNKRAVTLKKEANNSLKILITLILLGGLSLYFLLWKTPEGMLKSFFDEDKSVALRWTIVFITFISLIFVGIRYISKIMFSSYHLARDAEERQQLTYVYLALRKDASVDEKDRQLIIQSLFSRADTGLLKEDSSPTMPGGIEKFIK